MKKQHISIRTTLEPYGLVHISGDVSRNVYHASEPEFEPPFDVFHLRVVTRDGEVLQGRKEQGKQVFNVCSLDQIEVEKCEEVLIDKYREEEGFERDYLINEVIDSGRLYKHRAYA